MKRNLLTTESIVYFVHIRSFPHLQVIVLVFFSFLNVSIGEILSL
jgi:hypothetical protein